MITVYLQLLSSVFQLQCVIVAAAGQEMGRQRAEEQEASRLLADTDPCGRLCPHSDIFRGSPAQNRRNPLGAEQAVAMQQFVTGRQLDLSGEQQSGGGGGLNQCFEKPEVHPHFCSLLVGELSAYLII